MIAHGCKKHGEMRYLTGLMNSALLMNCQAIAGSTEQGAWSKNFCSLLLAPRSMLTRRRPILNAAINSPP